MAREVSFDAFPSRAQPPGRFSSQSMSDKRLSFSAFWPYVARYAVCASLAGVALLVAAAATLAMPVAVRYVIDDGFSGGSGASIESSFIFLMLAAGLLALASAARFYFVSWLSERVICDIRTDILGRVLLLSPAFFDETRTGGLVSSLTVDAAQVEKAMGTALSVALRNLLLLCGAVAMMVMTSPFLSVLIVGIAPLVVLPVVAFGRMVKRRSRHARELLADAVSCASEAVGAVRTIQAFNATRSVLDRFSGAMENAFDASRRAMLARAFLTATIIFTVFSGIAAVLWYGSHDVLRGDVTGGTLGQFVLYAILAAGAMGELSQMSGEILQSAGAASRLSELLEIQAEIRSPASPKALPKPARGHVAFENVSFAFPARPGKEVLKSISFSVGQGERVALVGASGAGKSTLFHLLLRYYDPIGGGSRSMACQSMRPRWRMFALILLSCRKTPSYSPLPLSIIFVSDVPARAGKRSWKPRARLRPILLSRRCPMGTIRRLANGASLYPAGNGSESPLLALSCAMRQCCYWMKRQARSTRKVRRSFRALSNA